MKGIPYLPVRLQPRDADVRAWTGHHNAPVAMYQDEPPRAGWAEILALAERIEPNPRLVPADFEARVKMFGLAQEILGEGGLVWCARLTLIHAGLTTNGVRGFSPRAGQYLGRKYGYAPERIDGARKRIFTVLDALGKNLADGRRYFFGDQLTALDIYVATALGVIHPLSAEACPTPPDFRKALETVDEDIRAAVPPALLSHRDSMYQEHLPLPVMC